MPKTTEQSEVLRILKDYGAVLERSRKHDVYRFPDGRIHVLPRSPSCTHAWKNQLADLRKFLNLATTDRGAAGERRPKKAKRTRKTPLIMAAPIAVSKKDFAAQLSAIVIAPPAPEIVAAAPVETVVLQPVRLTLWQRIVRFAKKVLNA